MNNCYGFFATGRGTPRPGRQNMILLMAGLVLFALVTGALSLLTGPVALAMAGLIAGWLLLFAARSAVSRGVLGRKGVRRG